MKFVSINRLSPGIFLNVTQYREIGKARIISRQEKKTRANGEPDVELITWANEKFYIARNDLVLNFLDAKGRKINVRTWKNSEFHVIMCQCNKSCGALHIPKSSRYGVTSESGRKYKPGSYVICLKNDKEELQTKNCVAVSDSLFNKMFIVNDSIDKLTSRVRHEKTIKTLRDSGKLTASIKNENGTIVKVDKELSMAKYTVIAKLVSMKTNKIVGYVVSYNGKKVNCSLAKVEKLCKAKKLKNMTVVYNDEASPYFRCIGMTHESLNKVYVN